MTRDTLHRFSFDGLPIRGQWVRLSSVLADATAAHDYPEPVRQLLAAQFAAVAMFADNLKFEGTVALQSRGSGALRRSLAECRERHLLRGIAHLSDAWRPPDNASSLRAWLADGQLALTLIWPEGPDGAPERPPYQGLIELSEAGFAANLEHYFTMSEQLPTRVFFGYAADEVTGLLVQRLPEPEGATEIETALHEEAWSTAQVLAETVAADELTHLEPATLLNRLFNEFHCRLHPPRALRFACTCSREKSDRTLRLLDDEEISALLEERGEIEVSCEFCDRRYTYDSIDVATLRTPGPGPGGGEDRAH